MKLFPTAIVSWTEPASYTYASRQRFAPGQFLLMIAVAAIFLLRARHFPIFGIVVFLVVGAIVLALPWLHTRWPGLFPLTGAAVTLFDDRITRRSGKSGSNVMLKNVSSCSYQICRDAQTQSDYWLLRFKVKSGGLSSLMSVVKETAVADAQVFEQVILTLRKNNIFVTQISTNEKLSN